MATMGRIAHPYGGEVVIPADLESHHDAARRQAAQAHLTLTIRQASRRMS